MTKEKTWNNFFNIRVFRILALTTVIAGAAGSLVIMLHTGRNNPSILIIGLFAVWVLSPFAALILANILSIRWSYPTRLSLYILMLGISCCSFIGYLGAWSPPWTRTAFFFLVIPMSSWMVMAIVIPIVTILSQKMLQKKGITENQVR
jgi:hypothetical protein